MVDRVPRLPAGVYPLSDHRFIVGVDPRRVGAILLRDRLGDSRSWLAAIMPGRARNPGEFERLALRSGRGRQLGDEIVFGDDELDGSLLVGTESGASPLIACKRPIAFPNAAFTASNSSFRAFSLANSDA